MLGSLLASGFFWLLRLVRWERINPGQDYNEWETQAQKDVEARSEHTITSGDQVHGSYSSGQGVNGNQGYTEGYANQPSSSSGAGYAAESGLAEKGYGTSPGSTDPTAQQGYAPVKPSTGADNQV